MAAAAKTKSCFVVGPIGSADSPERIHSDWVLEEIILPVFDAHFADFAVTRADKISKPGSINEQIISALLNSDLVIADLTTLNANCFYEIGIRHVVQKPIIHMHETGQHIPFDIAPFRSIEFSRVRPADIRAARAMLKEFIDTVLAPDYVLDNPVTFSRGRQEFEKTATEPEKIIQDQLSTIINRLSDLEDGRLTDRQKRAREERFIANSSNNFTEWAQKMVGGTLQIEVEAIKPLSDETIDHITSTYVSSHFLSPLIVSKSSRGFTVLAEATPSNLRGRDLFIDAIAKADLPIRVADSGQA